MKVIHLTVVRDLTSGQAKQLSYETAASAEIGDIEWITISVQATLPKNAFSRQIPRGFRGMFLRNLYGWLLAFRISRQCDYLIMRHMTFDPFALLFAPLIRNRVTVHHSKELEELKMIAPGWKGQAASILERVTGRVAVRTGVLIAGVTEEIAHYEQALHAPAKPVALYANGVMPGAIALLKDKRVSNQVHAAFLCGTFSAWHGLDKLIAAVRLCEPSLASKLRIHLIGNLSEEQISTLRSTSTLSLVFCVHGLLSEDEYRPILDQCHVGIGSLALERKSLSEASTLKVREMLAMGLPVYATHSDSSLPVDFLYYMHDSTVSIRNLVDFAEENASVTRSRTAESASPYIAKSCSMIRLVSALQQGNSS